jgi:protein required for attachment to host cells
MPQGLIEDNAGQAHIGQARYATPEGPMLQNGAAWFLIADGRRARVLIEERRGAILSEPADLKFEIGAGDLYEPQDRPARAFDSAGTGRHAMDGGRNLHEEEEEKFLRRVAQHIGAAEKTGSFHHLVIAAPPRALGILRNHLAPAVLARIRAEAAKDLLAETAPELRERLRELLR